MKLSSMAFRLFKGLPEGLSEDELDEELEEAADKAIEEAREYYQKREEITAAALEFAKGSKQIWREKFGAWLQDVEEYLDFMRENYADLLDHGQAPDELYKYRDMLEDAGELLKVDLIDEYFEAG